MYTTTYWAQKHVCNMFDAELLTDIDAEDKRVFALGQKNDFSAGIRSSRITPWMRNEFALELFCRVMLKDYVECFETDKELPMEYFEGQGMITYYDPESGRPLIAMTLEQAKACSHAGECDADVTAALPYVHIIASNDDIRQFLKGFGAWDEDELMNDHKNRKRLLWLAAGDIIEDNQTRL